MTISLCFPSALYFHANIVFTDLFSFPPVRSRFGIEQSKCPLFLRALRCVLADHLTGSSSRSGAADGREKREAEKAPAGPQRDLSFLAGAHVVEATEKKTKGKEKGCDDRMMVKQKKD